jgi:hypothetical protein
MWPFGNTRPNAVDANIAGEHADVAALHIRLMSQVSRGVRYIEGDRRIPSIELLGAKQTFDQMIPALGH